MLILILIRMKILFHKLQFRSVAVLTVLLPLSGFILCVGISVIYDFKSSTATHCGVSLDFLQLIIFLTKRMLLAR